MLNALFETMYRTDYFFQIIKLVLMVTQCLQRKRIISKFKIQLKTF